MMAWLGWFVRQQWSLVRTGAKPHTPVVNCSRVQCHLVRCKKIQETGNKQPSLSCVSF
eukprot:m.11484 g.11484  ORF g.11484 m.11484 type:complete len:58 (-) comp7712_c0_seq1:102-275(-)